MYFRIKNALSAFLFCLTMFAGGSLKAQLFGNEWIDTTKVHVKFPIAKDGIYRIGYFSVDQYFADANVFLNKIPFSQIRLYSMGNQVPVFVHDQNGNNFMDIFDYIEFVGHPLDGKFDAELYKTPTDQRHQLTSLISDTNYYFFTYRTSGSPLRYTEVSVTAPSTSPKTFHDCRVDFAPVVNYAQGRRILVGDKDVYEGDYTLGEGFCGDYFYGSKDVNAINDVVKLLTPHYYSAGPAPQLETGVIGASSYYFNNNHRIRFLVGPNPGSKRLLRDTTFASTLPVTIYETLKASDIGSPLTYIMFNSLTVGNIDYSACTHSHTILHYPREYKLDDSILYSYIEDTSSVARNIEWNGYGDGFFSLPVIYDEENLFRITGTYTLGQKRVNYAIPPMPKPGKMFMHDEAKIFTLNYDHGKIARMRNYDKALSTSAYLMITSTALASSPKEEVQNYVKTVWGSRYNVFLALSEELYNSFSYGIPHPLAIRHFCKYEIENSTPGKKPIYLLFLGRGYDMSYNRGVNRAALLPHLKKNHIPAMGTPVSDNLFTAGLDGTTLEPAIATGRVSADVAADIEIYRQKLISYINTGQNYDPWQKNILHLSGGASPDQALVIRNRMTRLENYVYKDPFAGIVTSFSKSAGTTVDQNFTTAITNQINNGSNLVTFLGHGSTSVTDIDIGNPETQYRNAGRYPIFYFNGCQVGNPCIPLGVTSTLPLAERVLKVPNAGGVAFVGQTTLSELYTVSSQMEAFYTIYFDSTTKGIGDVVKGTIKNFQSPANFLNRIHCQELFLQGDPAAPIYAPAFPDFAVTNGSLFLDPPNTIALQDSFRVGVIISNFGKGVKDSFSVNLSRLYPDGYTRRSYTQRWRMHGMFDTAYFIIRSKDKATGGKNIFSVSLNTEKTPIEYKYENNNYSQEFILPTNGVNLISPKRFAIVGTDSVELVAQASDIFKQNEDFYFEIDTTPRFNSPILKSLQKSQTPVKARVLAVWKVDLKVLKDTQTYYWRARLSSAKDEGGAWVMHSFTYIKDHGDGWMQNLFWQYSNKVSTNEFQNLNVDTTTGQMGFKKIAKKIYIDCAYGQSSNLGVKEAGFSSQDLNYGVCIDGGLVCIPWDGRKLVRKPVDTNQIKPNCYWGEKWTTFGHFEDYQLYYAFQMDRQGQRDSFVRFINAMEDSMYVTIYTRKWSYANLWDQSVFDALHKIGCHAFDSLNYRTDDAMYVALGKKGRSKGAQEAITLGKNFAYVQLEGDMVGDAYFGYMLSEKIGPVNQYSASYFRKYMDPSPSSKDQMGIDVIGLKADGTSDLLKIDVFNSPISLATVDTKKYKFLQLKCNVSDPGNHTPPALINWRVAHDAIPEGSLYPDAKFGYVFHEDTLYEGDSFLIKLPFRNIGKIAFRDSIRVDYVFSNKSTRAVLSSGMLRYTALAPDSQFVFVFKAPTVGLSGPYTLQVNVNQFFEQPENTLVNNSALVNFFVSRDNMSPLLDVTFDGRHILEGDIVSANPVIIIQSKDENKFLLQKDSANIEVSLKRPGSTVFQKVNWGSEAVFFAATDKQNKARVEYRPLDLPAGTYTLKVQSWDASDNRSGSVEYTIDFTVIREQTVTNFYPYPNPFSTSMRFVFTLTGTEVPDDIRVKIMTAEGRVVKEVSKEELGDVHIGNNISSWTWDGTDQFGDKLGNGTYFYRVTVRSHGEDVKLRATAGDAAFKEQVGVIYLLR